MSGGGDCLVYMASSPSLEGRSGLYLNNGIASYGVHRCVTVSQACQCGNEGASCSYRGKGAVLQCGGSNVLLLAPSACLAPKPEAGIFGVFSTVYLNRLM